MIKEDPEDKERWHRDPSVPLARTDITRFPHAVLELNLALRSGETTPNWLGELIESGANYLNHHLKVCILRSTKCCY